MKLYEFKSASAGAVNHAAPPPEFTCVSATVPERAHPLLFHPL